MGLISVMRLPGFGPKRAKKLYDEIGVDSLDALRAAVEDGRLRELRGFGVKAEENLRKVLAEHQEDGPSRRVVLSRAVEAAVPVLEALRAHPAADRVEAAGSLRRWTDSVKDVDIIATASDPAALAAALAELEIVESVSHSRRRGRPGDDPLGPEDRPQGRRARPVRQRAPALHGLKAHNVALREAAVRRGLHVSEYGILDDATGEALRCSTEEEVYAALGLDWIPPELREGRGELEAGGGGGLPDLIEVGDLRGDLHSPTTTSDGTETAETMARGGARARPRVPGHHRPLGHARLRRPRDGRPAARADRGDPRAQRRLDGFELLIGTETNILTDGAPDYPDDVLAELDWVVASIHTSFGMGAKKMTDRLVAAIEHPLVDAIGHPTGRKIEKRQPYELEMDRVIEAAARTGTMIEINGSPDRRDLNDVHARAAAEAGVRILVNSDAHSLRDLAEHPRYGIATARRAWLTADQVASTLPWKKFAKLRKRAAEGGGGTRRRSPACGRAGSGASATCGRRRSARRRAPRWPTRRTPGGAASAPR